MSDEDVGDVVGIGASDTASVTVTEDAKEDAAKLQIHTKAVVKKFEGDVPPEHGDDPEAHGHKLVETVIMEDGKETQVIPGEGS